MDAKEVTITTFTIIRTNAHYFTGMICELIGLYLLYQIKHFIDSKHIALYLDDGLAVLHNYSKIDLERVFRKLRPSIKDMGFNITIEPGLRRTNFLDITLDLTKDIYKPYKKNNKTTSYINSQSNHPY